MGNNIGLNDIFNKESIIKRARENWDFKDSESRRKSGHKYRHIFLKSTKPINDWSETFEKLTKEQQNILVKGELIRTYDALPNIDKTYLKRQFNLSTFSSKWFKLPSSDKHLLLKYVI
jgi:hypothetical protein